MANPFDAKNNTTQGIAMAIVSGFLYATAANLASYYAHRESAGAQLKSRSKYCVNIGSFLLFGFGGFLMTMAYASGVCVAVINAVMVATNLVTNMAMQMWLQLHDYTKNMRVGTFVFVAAVLQLGFIGPAERPEDVEIHKLFSQKTAIAWFVTVGCLSVISLLGVQAASEHERDSMPKIFSWALFISCLAVVADNTASSFKLLQGWLLYVVIFGYMVISVILLGLSSKAPGICSVAVYVPAQLCTQLIFNMLTGLLVWDDTSRLQALSPYLAAFSICVLSVYLASPGVDLWQGARLWVKLRTGKLSDEIAKGPLGKSILQLLDKWGEIRDGYHDPDTEKQAQEALRTMLEEGSKEGVIASDNLIDLVIALFNQSGCKVCSAGTVEWIESLEYFQRYIRQDDDFKNRFRDVLPDDGFRKLTSRYPSAVHGHDSGLSESESVSSDA